MKTTGSDFDNKLSLPVQTA